MKKKIFRISYIIFVVLFYFTFWHGVLSFEIEGYPVNSFAELSIASLVPAVSFLIAAILTPFVIGCGAFLFFKYPKQKRGDVWHYCLIYPGFAIFSLIFIWLVWKIVSTFPL